MGGVDERLNSVTGVLVGGSGSGSDCDAGCGGSVGTSGVGCALAAALDWGTDGKSTLQEKYELHVRLFILYISPFIIELLPQRESRNYFTMGHGSLQCIFSQIVT